MNFVGPALKRAREKYGRTIKEVASEMGITVFTVALSESHVYPEDNLLEWYSANFRADLAELRRAREASKLPKAGSK